MATFNTRPQVLTDEIARNTMTGFWTLLAISTATAIALTPRACRSAREAHKWTTHRQPAGASPGMAKTLGRYRVWFLYMASVLLLLEAVNSLVYYHNLWVFRDGNAIAMNVIRTFTIYPAGPLMVVATGWRISLLLSIRPRLRALLVRSLTAVTLAVMLTGMITNLVVIALNAELARDLVAWQSVVMFPSWMAPILAVIPLGTVGMTLWSLKVSFGAQVKAEIVSLPSIGDNLNTSGTSSHSAADEGGEYVHPASLGITFKILTFLLALYWSVYLTVVALYRPFRVHSTAITAPITALAIATEASFEWLTHAVASQRRRELAARSKRETASRSRQQLLVAAVAKSVVAE